MKNSIKQNLTPLKKGWLFVLLHIVMTYLAVRLHLHSQPKIDIAPVTDYFGVLQWLTEKGMDDEYIYACTFYAIVLAPLSLISWHFFMIDAKPRRPKPKFRHSFFVLLYLLPILAFLRYAKPSGQIEEGFKSPLLRVIAGSDITIAIVITMVAWLIIGLCYFAILPLWEMSLLYRTKGNKK